MISDVQKLLNFSLTVENCVASNMAFVYTMDFFPPKMLVGKLKFDPKDVQQMNSIVWKVFFLQQLNLFHSPSKFMYI